MKQKAAVLALCFTTLIYLVLTVSVAGLLAAFPDVSERRVMLVLTLPNLTSVLGLFCVPLLAPRVSQRAMALGSLGALLLGGAVCLLFHDSLPVLLAAACLMGLSYGFLSTLYPMLVNRLFDGRERIAVMGMGAGMLQLGRLASNLIGGFLGEIHWYWVYWTFGFVLIALVLCAAWLPAGIPAAEPGARDAGSLNWGGVWKLSAAAMLFAASYFIISTHASLYVEGYGLGTASITGVLSALSYGAAGITAAFYERISRRTGKHTLAIAFLVIGAGYTAPGLRHSLVGACLAFLAGAVGIALFTPWLMVAVSDAAGRWEAPAAMAVVLTCVNVGYFLSPYLTNTLSSVLGDGGSASAFLWTGVLALLAGTVLMAIQKRN